MPSVSNATTYCHKIMIRITNPEYIRTSGDFKLDGLLIKRHEFEKQTSELGKESLTMEAVPFKRMDDGKIMSSPERVHKIVENDLVSLMSEDNPKLSAECKLAVQEAYFATEKANTMLFNELCGKDLQLVWEAPQA